MKPGQYRLLRLAWLAGTMAGLPPAALAQPVRDPTAPPPAERALPAAPTGVAQPGSADTAQAGPMGVVVRDGKPYVLSGTRLYASGQMLGAAQIERITETEIWLREGGELRKIARYGAIVRRAEPDPASGPPCPGASAASPARVSRVARSASAPKIGVVQLPCANRQH